MLSWGLCAATVVFAAASALLLPAAAAPKQQLARLCLETLQLVAGWPSEGNAAAGAAAAGAAAARRYPGDPCGAAAAAAKALATATALGNQQPLLRRPLAVSLHLASPKRPSAAIYKM